MLLPNSALLQSAKVFAIQPSKTDPVFPKHPQSPHAPVVVIPKRILVCPAQMAAPERERSYIGTVCAPNTKHMADLYLLGDPNGCGVDCLAISQSNQLVDVLTVIMTKLNIKTILIDFL